MTEQNTKIHMVISDLDGTLLDKNHKLSKENKSIFKKLSDLNIIRVIATGRNPFSFNRVIPQDMPIDYLVFSSGAGIMNWKNKTILHSEILKAYQVNYIARHFRQNKISFMLQAPIPDNHHFIYSLESEPLPDFNRRLKLYDGYARPVDWDDIRFGDASQFIVILPNDVECFENVRANLKNLKIIRATSPLDRKSIWMEIFPKQVSKANAVNYLCKLLNINLASTCGFGNDYNDIDLLNFTRLSFVVSNAPEKLRSLFSVIGSNEENGVSIQISKLISDGLTKI